MDKQGNRARRWIRWRIMVVGVRVQQAGERLGRWLIRLACRL